jgi:phosphoribosylaminoimidazole (AIR) synthetase
MLEPSGLGVEIADPIEPPEIMLKMQELRGFDDRTAYGKWHMGPGMVIATPEPKKVLEAAEAQGVVAKEIGRVTEKSGIRVRNKGVRQDSPWLDFAPHNS